MTGTNGGTITVNTVDGGGAILTFRVSNTGMLSAPSFMGTISGTTLTVTAISTGFLSLNQTIVATGNTPLTTGTSITAFGSGSGGLGTYTVSYSQTVSVAEPMVGLLLTNPDCYDWWNWFRRHLLIG